MNLKCCSECGCVVDFNSMLEIDISSNISEIEYNKEYARLKKTKRCYEILEYCPDEFFCPCCNKWVSATE